MSDNRIEGYARGLFEIARAEGTLDEVEDELFRFARSFEGSDALRTALSDEQIPPAKRQAIIEDLLGGKATSTTTQLISMVVGSGRTRDLPAIVDLLVARASSAKHQVRYWIVCPETGRSSTNRSQTWSLFSPPAPLNRTNRP